MTQLQWFRFFAPEFSTLSDVEVGVLLTAAAVFVDTNGLTEGQANSALALYAAHLQWVKVNQTSAGASYSGSIKSEKEGDLSRTYADMDGDTTWIGQSPYGLQFNSIMAAKVGGCIMTRYGV